MAKVPSETVIAVRTAYPAAWAARSMPEVTAARE